MKILMLPAWLPNRLELFRLNVGNYAAVTSFFTEQADDLHRHSGWEVDVLMPKIYALAKLPRLRSMPVFGREIHQRVGGETWIGYTPYLLPHSRPRHWRHFGDKLFAAYLQKRGMPDMVWCCGVLWSAFLANHLLHKYSLPYFVVEHSNWNVMDGGTKKARKIKGEIIRVLREARFAAAPSADAAGRMDAFVGDSVAGGTRVITNSISEFFENIEVDEVVDDAADFVFHSTGRLDDNKNHAALIAAFAEFAQAVPAARLDIAGAGAADATLRAQIAAAGLAERVRLLGYLGRSELAAHMRCAAAYVSASHSETFNIALIEALACGLPCVSTPTGVAVDAIDDSNGIVVRSGAATDILAGMRHVYGERQRYNRQTIRADALARFSGAVVAAQIKDNLNKNSY